jgi:GntR family transcriptional regulator/MocR family aminotransferase
MPRSKTSSDAELLVKLGRDAAIPLHQQLEQELRAAVRNGRLPAGSPMPSTRSLAAELRLSRGVVVEAYEQLIAEGYLTSRPGGTTQVAPYALPTAAPAARPLPTEPAIYFRYGRPDVSEFPRSAWLRSLRTVLNEAPNERLSYSDGRGVPELRAALAAYLNRVRGTAADAENIVVCSGFAQGMTLISQVLRAAGAQRMALEDPSSDDTPIAQTAGLAVVGIPVDEAGICIDALAQAEADAVLVTAAHQFPVGGVLPPDRRSALVGWATARDALIIEDDYDAEYRYDREPIGAIQGLAPDRVVYIGSASKTLAPGLRLGWMIVPPALVDRVAAAKLTADRGSPAIEQLSFADFLTRGEFDHHLRRMRPIYRRRRDALPAALQRYVPELQPVGASAGLHVLAWLPGDVNEARVLEEAKRLGVGIDGLEKYRITHRDGPGGLIFGYANLNERAIDEGIRLLAQAIAASTH